MLENPEINSPVIKPSSMSGSHIPVMKEWNFSVIFGTLFASLIIMNSCTTQFHTQRMEDDIYYSAHDTAAAENYSNYTGVGERRTQGRKDNAEEQTQHVKDRKNHTDSDRINRSIVSTLGYIMLDALYLFLIFE